uniref:Uncharacterized protein n=1 Tax=Rhizophagus irregularis (strain DAOM 181602 / DAOM 197198 / MUCL 43194) TaxID=747089 RepID=U9TCV4_RHIID
MKKKRVKYLAIINYFSDGTSTIRNYVKKELFSLKNEVKEFELYDIKIQKYKDLVINSEIEWLHVTRNLFRRNYQPNSALQSHSNIIIITDQFKAEKYIQRQWLTKFQVVPRNLKLLMIGLNGNLSFNLCLFGEGFLGGLLLEIHLKLSLYIFDY